MCIRMCIYLRVGTWLEKAIINKFENNTKFVPVPASMYIPNTET